MAKRPPRCIHRAKSFIGEPQCDREDGHSGPHVVNYDDGRGGAMQWGFPPLKSSHPETPLGVHPQPTPSDAPAPSVSNLEGRMRTSTCSPSIFNPAKATPTREKGNPEVAGRPRLVQTDRCAWDQCARMPVTTREVRMSIRPGTPRPSATAYYEADADVTVGLCDVHEHVFDGPVDNLSIGAQGCVHQDEPDCMVCDATTTTHPYTRCRVTQWVDGALPVRCVKQVGHQGRHNW